ncbi:PhzF family phenazine biosynthesis protein [Fulvivirgaceae bacterium BMA10]|uniref:PhzF family phenazine biosynthesis protein n=1 Tax=Splendidivirga corallicola TaxID=3051826 RepID=A0ABT8KSN6_9BACT|nr:PhzF family phenazine biosynthesis protein [Fulvivirgaceae bacterium BMA10]
MSKIKIFQVDAFTKELFKGNPAAICPLETWLDDDVMQSIAAENNLAETAFIVKVRDQYEIRWFTPAVEVDLCGHATLAAGHVIFKYLGHSGNEVSFYSPRSGPLKVIKDGDLLTLDFPVDEFVKTETPEGIKQAFQMDISETYKGKTDYMVVLPSQQDLEALKPDFRILGEVNGRGVIATAPGTEVDFVSRFFGPQSGIDEDPVTGSAHTTLTPYWSAKLGKQTLFARQLSSRQGDLKCKLNEDRVEISGNAKTYLIGEIEIDL